MSDVGCVVGGLVLGVWLVSRRHGSNVMISKWITSACGETTSKKRLGHDHMCGPPGTVAGTQDTITAVARVK